MKALKLDIDFVRGWFPQLQDEPEFVFCANAGGSYVAQPVIDSLDITIGTCGSSPTTHTTRPGPRAWPWTGRVRAGRRR